MNNLSEGCYSDTHRSIPEYAIITIWLLIYVPFLFLGFVVLCGYNVVIYAPDGTLFLCYGRDFADAASLAAP